MGVPRLPTPGRGTLPLHRTTTKGVAVKVRMLTRIEGTRNQVRWPDAGTVVDLPAGEAADLVAVGLAVPVAEEPRKATARKPEKRG